MTNDFEKPPRETKLRFLEDEVRLREVDSEQPLASSESIPTSFKDQDSALEPGANSCLARTDKQEPGGQSNEAPVEAEPIRTTQEPAPFKPLTPQEKINSFVCYITVPCALMFAHYMALPGFWLLGNQMVRTILLGLFIWFFIGGAIYAQCRHWLAKLLCIVIFVMPLLMAGSTVPIIAIFSNPDFLRALFHLGRTSL